MSEWTEVTFPRNPCAASRPKVPRYGKPYYVGNYKTYREDMALLVPQSLTQAGISEPSSEFLEVSAIFCMQKPRTSKLAYPHQDTDNLLKAILDACNRRLWVDDKQIIKLTGEKCWSITGEGRTVLRMRTL